MKPLLEKTNTIALEKLAYATHLGKDSKEWPITILQEAYKQVPYLRNYEVDVTLDRTDESRGFGVGKMLVYPHKMEKNAAVESNRIVSFPIIIRDHEVAPLDVISFKEEIRPASETFISEKLFKPEVFEHTARAGQFQATGLGAQIDPPAQRLRQSVGIHKHSSVKLLDAVLLNATTEQLNEFRDYLTKSASLRYAAVSNPAFSQAVDKILSTKEKTASDIRTMRQDTIKPTTVQFRKDGSYYFVKTANHNVFAPTESKISRFEAQAYLSNAGFEKLCSVGHVTFTVDPVQQETEILKTASAVTRVGVYETVSNSTPVSGIVIPKMISLEGDVLHTKLFITKTASAMQEDIAGIYVSPATLENSNWRGRGVFAMQDGNRGLATEVVDIQNYVEAPFGKEKLAYYVAKRSASGETIKLSKVDGLKKIASMGENHYAIPSTMSFISLPSGKVSVCEKADDYRDREMLKKASSLQVVCDGHSWQIKGSEVFTDIMNDVDTSFALSAYGFAPNQIENLLEKSASVGFANIYSHREIHLESKVKDALMSKIASTKINVKPIQVDLIKEASVIVDKETVDSILALKFLTPENVGTYINYIPELEKTAQKLAEILVATRLGMDDIKEIAAKNALTQMTTVIDGLHGLRSKVL